MIHKKSASGSNSRNDESVNSWKIGITSVSELYLYCATTYSFNSGSIAEPQNFSPADTGSPQCGQTHCETADSPVSAGTGSPQCGQVHCKTADGGLIEGFFVEDVSVFDSGCGVINGLSGDTVSKCCCGRIGGGTGGGNNPLIFLAFVCLPSSLSTRVSGVMLPFFANVLSCAPLQGPCFVPLLSK